MTGRIKKIFYKKKLVSTVALLFELFFRNLQSKLPFFNKFTEETTKF